MKRIALVLALALCAAPAAAQLYKWVDKDGKVRYGDTPPPGAKTNTVRPPAEPAAGAAPAAAKDAKKGPQTAAEREMDFRKRQAEARKAEEAAAREKEDKAKQAENCDRAREYLRTLESGQRISRLNASGERFFLDENQVRQETEKARATEKEACK